MSCTAANAITLTVVADPETTAVSPGYDANVIGAAAVPDRVIRNPAYVPPRMFTVAPAVTVDAACCSVCHGALTVPGLASLPELETKNPGRVVGDALGVAAGGVWVGADVAVATTLGTAGGDVVAVGLGINVGAGVGGGEVGIGVGRAAVATGVGAGVTVTVMVTTMVVGTARFLPPLA